MKKKKNVLNVLREVHQKLEMAKKSNKDFLQNHRKVQTYHCIVCRRTSVFSRLLYNINENRNPTPESSKPFFP
jgi:hypothetical protein